MWSLAPEQIDAIHAASLELLQTVGVVFHSPRALETFREQGFKVDGATVFFTEEQIQQAIDSSPARFVVTARNAQRSIEIGSGVVLAPGYGPPNIALTNGDHRPSTKEDYHNFCKLVQTSKCLDMNGFMMVSPSDLSHRDMLLASITLCDKPFMGSPLSLRAAEDCVEMAKIVFDDFDDVSPVTVSLINSLSPLAFSPEMSDALIILAAANQACIISPMIMAGLSGPVSLAGVLALQNAEVLAGLTLAQLVRPGAPVIYGSASSATDLRTGNFVIGCPEGWKLTKAAAQLARFYGLPCRGGGGLTDSHLVDGQAGAEAAAMASIAFTSGINFILHAAGILGSYIAMSYEKFLLDEEILCMLRAFAEPIATDEQSIDLAAIKEVGIGGLYITHPKTVEQCRTVFHIPDLMSRENHTLWRIQGAERFDQVATKEVDRRLEAYEKPAIDPETEEALNAYVQRSKGHS